MKRIAIVCIMMITAALPLSAEELTLSLQEAIYYARVNSRDGKMMQLSGETIQQELEAGWNTWVPNVSVSAVGNVDEPFDDPGYMFQTQIQASLPVSFTYGLEQEMTAAALHRQQLGGEQLFRQLDLLVARHYLSLRSRQHEIELAERNLEMTQGDYESAEIAFEAGSLSRLELLQRQQAVDTVSFELERLETEYQRDISSLMRLLGLPQEDVEAINLPDTLPTDYQFEASSEEIEKMVGQAMDADVDIRQLQAQSRSKELELDITRRRSFWPSVNLSGEYSITYMDPLSMQAIAAGMDNWSDSHSFSISGSIPVSSFFPGSSARLSVDRLEREIESSALELASAREDLEEELRELVDDLRLAAMQVDQASRAADLAGEVYEASEAAYEAGSISYRELQQAYYDVMESENRLIGARLSYEVSLIRLNDMLGIAVAELFDES